MEEHNVVAVYNTAARADAAVLDLKAAGIPAGSISQHANTGSQAGAPVREEGFWSKLFGTESHHDSALYDRSIERGSTVVTVRVSEDQFDRVSTILERHDPVDLEEGSAGYSAGTSTSPAHSSMDVRDTASSRAGMTGSAATARGAGNEGASIQLAEEALSVGKRAVQGGATRIRKYTVATPVEEQVRLRDEKVTVERRPVTEGRPVTGEAFTDKTIEMHESREEAVVSKEARVKEEIALRKEANERVETVKDTVRREEVEIEQDGKLHPGSRTETERTGYTAETDRTLPPGSRDPNLR